MVPQIKDISWFTSVCVQNDLTLNGYQTALLEKYRELLLSWNSRINLLSRKDEGNFYPNHALNCISFLFTWKLKSDALILDLGTGGGLPGIPLKIIYPNLHLVLLDSIVKKTVALLDMVNQMQLENVEILMGRAEELRKLHELRGKFDYVISRAAGKLDEVIKWSRDFLKPDIHSQQGGTEMPELLGNKMIPAGNLIVLKGGAVDNELKLARRIKFVESLEVKNIVFHGMDEIENKDKKIVLVKYRTSAMETKI